MFLHFGSGFHPGQDQAKLQADKEDEKRAKDEAKPRVA